MARNSQDPARPESLELPRNRQPTNPARCPPILRSYAGGMRYVNISGLLGIAVLILATVASAQEPASCFFAIQVVDEQTGRGVPLVELQTTSAVSYYTDSNGLIAFDEPGLM